MTSTGLKLVELAPGVTKEEMIEKTGAELDVSSVHLRRTINENGA